jgi:hypothetical protein
MSDDKLLYRLQNAYQCCAACGEHYGHSTTRYESVWHGVCDVCGLEIAVSPVRGWGYLESGIQRLSVPARS